MAFEYRSKSWFSNIFTSAISSILALQIITVISGLIFGQKIEDKLIAFMWPLLGAFYLVFLVTRSPRTNKGLNDNKELT